MAQSWQKEHADDFQISWHLNHDIDTRQWVHKLKIKDWIWPTWAMLAALMQAFSMALPFHAGPSGMLQCLAMMSLAAFMVGEWSLASTFWWNLLFQTCALLCSVWWIYISLHQYGMMPAPLAAFAVVFLCVGLALYWAVAAVWLRWVWHQNINFWLQTAINAWSFAAAWMFAELARAVWFTGFPWAASGYAHTQDGFSFLAPYVGVYGIGALSAMLAMSWVQVSWVLLKANRSHPHAQAARWIWLSLGLLWCVLNAPRTLYPSWSGEATDMAKTGHEISVKLLQGNVPQESKFTTARQQANAWYEKEILNSKEDLVVTPETAFAQTAQAMPEQFWRDVIEHSKRNDSAVLMGMPLEDGNGYSNSALGVLPTQRMLYRYDKHHLVPFGEFFPPFFKWFTDQMQMPLTSFMRGDLNQSSMQWRGERIAPNICYEDLFGEELAARFANPREAPTILVNMSNIAWFGDSAIVDQHLEISRMRTLELERPMLRATNSGATAIINERGVVLAQMPAFEQGSLTALVRGIEREPTYFAQWASKYGLWPLWLLSLMTGLLLSAWTWKKNKTTSHG